jgi:hypothetical protein
MAHSKFLKSDIIKSCQLIISRIREGQQLIKDTIIDGQIKYRNKTNKRMFFPTRLSTDRNKVWDEIKNDSDHFFTRPRNMVEMHCRLQYDKVNSILTMCLNSCDDHVYLTDDDAAQFFEPEK